VPGNDISPSLDPIEVTSDELEQVRSEVVRAEEQRDDAIDVRDGLRARLVELGDERGAAVQLLLRRRVELAARAEERAAAVRLHQRRAREADAARVALGRAREALRRLLVAAYVSESASVTDEMTVLSGEGDVNDALTRLALGEAAVSGRARDVRRRQAERARAVEARTRARDAREQAEQAERDATTARSDAEQSIVAIDAETLRTQDDERRSVEAVAERQADVLVELADIPAARLRGDVDGAAIDFQLVALDAWVKATAIAPCRMEWWMLAGISKIEGRHGTFRGGQLDARGFPSLKIIGPALTGAGAFALIRDTDGGLLDEDPLFDRAVGPMQFIPSTWARWGRDGDGDGFANPHNIYDAAAGAAAYLCAGRGDLTDEAQLRAAYFSYNHSLFYVSMVLNAAREYQAALRVAPHVPEPIFG